MELATSMPPTDNRVSRIARSGERGGRMQIWIGEEGARREEGGVLHTGRGAIPADNER